MRQHGDAPPAFGQRLGALVDLVDRARWSSASSARSATPWRPAHAACSAPAPTITSPTTSLSCEYVTNPGRSRRTCSPSKPTMVDSRPIWLSPPSSTTRTASPNSSRTCSARVGLTRPKRLADGAAMPPPNAVNSCCAIGCEGTRIATVSCPPVTTSCTASERGSTIVSGPGQKRAASFCAFSRHLARPAMQVLRVVEVDDHRDGRPGAPSARRCAARPPGSARSRRAHRRFRSGTRPARRRATR